MSTYSLISACLLCLLPLSCIASPEDVAEAQARVLICCFGQSLNGGELVWCDNVPEGEVPPGEDMFDVAAGEAFTDWWAEGSFPDPGSVGCGLFTPDPIEGLSGGEQRTYTCTAEQLLIPWPLPGHIVTWSGPAKDQADARGKAETYWNAWDITIKPNSTICMRWLL